MLYHQEMTTDGMNSSPLKHGQDDINGPLVCK